jgi:hypothetical protein
MEQDQRSMGNFDQWSCVRFSARDSAHIIRNYQGHPIQWGVAGGKLGVDILGFSTTSVYHMARKRPETRNTKPQDPGPWS